MSLSLTRREHCADPAEQLAAAPQAKASVFGRMAAEEQRKAVSPGADLGQPVPLLQVRGGRLSAARRRCAGGRLLREGRAS